MIDRLPVLPMSSFATLPLSLAPAVVAPDGSDVRVLLGLAGGSMAAIDSGCTQFTSGVHCPFAVRAK